MSTNSNNAQIFDANFSVEQILILFKAGNLTLEEATDLLKRNKKTEAKKAIAETEKKPTDVFQKKLSMFIYNFLGDGCVLVDHNLKSSNYEFMGNYLLKIETRGLIWTANFVNESSVIDNRKFCRALKALERNKIVLSQNDFVWNWEKHSTIWWNAQLLIRLLEE